MLSEMWSEIRYRMRALVRRDAVERELATELHFHIEKEAEKYERLGLTRDEAVRRARLAFGGIERMKDESRDARGTSLVERLAQDARYAARSLRKQPAFSTTVVITLAIGIGANTTVFTLLDALLLRPLPVPHAEQLVTIGDPGKVHSAWHGSPMVDYVSYPVYADIRDGNHVLAGVYATGTADIQMVARGGSWTNPDEPNARFVSSNFFSVLEVPAWAGHTFSGRDDSGAREPAVVISFAYWQHRFGGDRSVLGSTVDMNHVPVTIIGIAPPSFTGDIIGENTDMWLPIALQPILNADDTLLEDRAASWLDMMGRLAPGVTVAQARAELSAIELRSIRSHLTSTDLADFDRDIVGDPVRVEPGARGFSVDRDLYKSALYVLMAAVVLVVLVVCANISNLMLARAVTRARELGVRMTLGAGRARLVSQLMTESVLLGVAGAVLGLVLTTWATRALLAVVRLAGESVVIDARPDARILGFTIGVTVFCVLAVGLIPALRATRLDLAASLRAHGRSLVGARSRLGRTLVIAQIALSMLMLVGVGLLVHSMRELTRADLGLDRDHLLLVHVAAGRSDYVGARLQALRVAVANRARTVPGVVDASYSEEGVFSGGESLGHVDIPGVVTERDSAAAINFDMVGPRYLHTLGATMLRGRDFDAHDANAGANSAVLDATMARAYFPHGDAIGRTVTLDSVQYTVVGIVRDVQEASVRGAPVRRMYVSRPFATDKPRSFELIVRVARDPASYTAALPAALSDVLGAIKVFMSPLDNRIRQSVSQDLLLTQVTACFGAIALLLAALGLYGVIAYSTKQRTSEFGLRVALGAEPGRVARMILREGVVLASTGVVIGIPIGLAAARLIRDQLFGVSTVDVPSLGAAILVLVTTALLASYLPARRAARVPPVEALRAD